jgi:SAM-dependent methyltransferase
MSTKSNDLKSDNILNHYNILSYSGQKKDSNFSELLEIFQIFINATTQKKVLSDHLFEHLMGIGTYNRSPTLSLLDVGAGQGAVIRYLLTKLTDGCSENAMFPIQAILLEPAFEFQKYLLSLKNDFGIFPNVKLKIIQSNICNCLNENKKIKFDVILFLFVINYLKNEERVQAILNSYSRLNPGGWLCVTACHTASWIGRLHKSLLPFSYNYSFPEFSSHAKIEKMLISLKLKYNMKIMESDLYIDRPLINIISDNSNFNPVIKTISFLTKIDEYVLYQNKPKKILEEFADELYLSKSIPLKDVIFWIYKESGRR